MAKMPPVKKTAPTKTAQDTTGKEAPAKTTPTKGATATAAGATPATVAPFKYGIQDLAHDVHQALPLVAAATIEKVLSAGFIKMGEAYARGGIVNIKDYGKLEIKHRPERQGRNPKTGDPMTIAAKSVPKFTFAKKLKDAVA